MNRIQVKWYFFKLNQKYHGNQEENRNSDKEEFTFAKSQILKEAKEWSPPESNIYFLNLQYIISKMIPHILGGNQVKKRRFRMSVKRKDSNLSTSNWKIFQIALPSRTLKRSQQFRLSLYLLRNFTRKIRMLRLSLQQRFNQISRVKHRIWDTYRIVLCPRVYQPI